MLWHLLNQNIVASLVGTFAGVSIAFWVNAREEHKKREHLYGVVGDQIAFEWAANAEYAKEIAATIESGNATVRRLNLKIAETALEQSYLYEFAPREFINKLRIYRENVLILNRLMDYYFSKPLAGEEIESLKETLQNIAVLIDELGEAPMR